MSATRRDVQAYFDGFAAAYESARYESPASVYAYNLICRRAEILALTADLPGRVLDVGTGPGALLEGLLAQGHPVTAVDLSFEMVRRAAAKSHAGRGPAVGAAAVEDLPFATASFDVVVAAGVIEYVDEDAAALRELRRVLRPGGSAILSFPLRRRASRLVRAAAAPVLGLLRGARPRPARSRDYSRRRVETLLARAGLRPIERRHLHFVFFPLDVLAPGVATRLEPPLRSLGCRLGVAWLAKTYLVRAEAI